MFDFSGGQMMGVAPCEGFVFAPTVFGAAPPGSEGLEYTLGAARLDYSAHGEQLDFTMPPGRLHYRLKDEDG